MRGPHPKRPRRGDAAGFRRAAGGAAAIEFALILPFMLALWAGMAEMAHAIDNWRKVTLLARTVADLTSQGDTTDPIAAATMSDILAASTAVLQPFAGTNARIVVSALGIDTTASVVSPRVCSSISNASNAYPRATGIASDLTIPAGYSTNGTRYVLAEVTMPYSPMIGSALVRLVNGIGTITLRASFPWPVRNGVVHKSAISAPEVVMPSGSPCP